MSDFLNVLESTETFELATALAKAQMEMPIAEKNSYNPFFKSKFADFQSIVESSRPCLTKYGLCVTQQIINLDEGHPFLVTKLRHSSGQWIMSKIRVMPVKNDIQSISSCITYLKRMSYASLVGMVAGEIDDDGEVASNRYEASDAISEAQLGLLQRELNSFSRLTKHVLSKLKIDDLCDIPKSIFNETYERIRVLKQDPEWKD